MIGGILCFCHVCLFVFMSVVNLNIRYNFRTIKDRSFICGMHIRLMMPISNDIKVNDRLTLTFTFVLK